MKVTFYVNTMFVLESTATRILCDPWVTFDDQSVSGFYNFPRCTLSRTEVAAIKPDFIYITHTHPDHFDPPTLALFDRKTPILVSWYENNFTERAVRKLGFHDVRVVPVGNGLSLGGEDHVWVEPAATSPEVDSIAVFRLGGMTALNANDNSLNREQCERLRNAAGGIDIGLIPSGAHGPWPMFFENLTEADMITAARERERHLKESFRDYISVIRPRWVVPVAGGVICAGDKAAKYKYSGIKSRREVVESVKNETEFEAVLMSQGMSYDFKTGKINGTYINQDYDTEASYLHKLGTIPSMFSPGGPFYIDPMHRIDLSRLLTLARKTMTRWQEAKRTRSGIAFYFDVGEPELYRLSLADEHVSRVREKDITDSRYEIFRTPYEVLLGLVTRHFIWSNVNTQHMKFFRKNDRGVDRDLMLMLNYLQI